MENETHEEGKQMKLSEEVIRKSFETWYRDNIDKGEDFYKDMYSVDEYYFGYINSAYKAWKAGMDYVMDCLITDLTMEKVNQEAENE